MSFGLLGKVYTDGERIVTQGEVGHCMYVIQQGKVEVFVESENCEAVLATLKPGTVFGEMALFTKETRSASVRAKGEARILTIDKRAFFKRVQEDPSLAFRILQKMSIRIRKLDTELIRLKTDQGL
jgi:CRP-like cAMP-binding protein